MTKYIIEVSSLKKMIRSLAAMAVALMLIGCFATAPAQASVAGNGYPWTVSSYSSGSYDSWGYVVRSDASYVAWAEYNQGISIPSNSDLGPVYNWPANAIRLGYLIDTTPIVGSVAWFSSGHVARVAEVSYNGYNNYNGYNYNSVRVEEYVGGVYATRWITPSEAASYIHFEQGRGGYISPPNYQPTTPSTSTKIKLVDVSDNRIVFLMEDNTIWLREGKGSSITWTKVTVPR